MTISQKDKRPAFVSAFPNGEWLYDIYDAIEESPSRHVLGAPAKLVFAKEFSDEDEPDIIIATPTIHAWNPRIWSLSKTETSDSFPVFINESGYGCMYETELPQKADIWPEAPFDEQTHPRMDRDQLVQIINQTRIMCGPKSDCMSFALTMLILLTTDSVQNLKDMLPFRATPETTWQTFATIYSDVTKTPLLTRSHNYPITAYDIVELLRAGHAIQLSLPATTQLLTSSKMWYMTQSAHIITIVMLSNDTIVIVDNNGAIPYDESELQDMLDSRKRPQTRLERLWQTTIQGCAIKT